MALFNELFTKVFRSSLLELSSHQHGNFVVQALISHATDQNLVLCIVSFASEYVGNWFSFDLNAGHQLILSSVELIGLYCMCLWHIF